MNVRTLAFVAIALITAGCGGRGRGGGSSPIPDGGTLDTSTPPVDTGTPCTTNADCAGASGACGTAVCDTGAGRCVVGTAAPDGTPCDDGDFCTNGDSCTGGTCAGTALDCTTFSAPCATGICDPSSGTCIAMPVMDGLACDDGSPCTVGDQCMGGSCAPGAATDCSGLTDACNDGWCDPMSGGCVAVERPSGTPCTDSDACTSGDTCSFGVCGGTVVDCSAMADQCNTAACDPSSGACVRSAHPPGWACDDGSLCTGVDQCSRGLCVGAAPLNCAGMTDQCNTGTCDPMLGCTATPVSDGTPCNDGDTCTPVDRCTGGVCGGPSTCCGPGDFQITEFNGYSVDYIEVQNRGTCTLNANTVSLRYKGGCDPTVTTFTFPSRMIPPNGYIRLVEDATPLTNEVYLGRTMCHAATDTAWAMLCQGPCNIVSCANAVDYMEQNRTTTRPTGRPACATFTPLPVQVTAATGTNSVTRVAYTGSGAAGRQSDWAIRPWSRTP